MITIMFTCKQCGLLKKEIRCKGRMTPESDLGWWMREVVNKAVAKAHRRHSKTCRSNLVDLYLPASDEEGNPLLWIGQDEKARIPP